MNQIVPRGLEKHSGHIVCWTILFAAVVVFAGRYWLHWDGFIPGTYDETLWIPSALRLINPSLFQNDLAISALSQFFPKAYIAIIAVILKMCGEPKMFLLSISTILLMIYSAGVYRLCWVVLGHRLTALMLAIISFRVNVDLIGQGWGIFLGHAIPRSFIIAAAPWIICVFIQNADSMRTVIGLGFALGLLGNIHPVTALHIYLIIFGAILLNPRARMRLKLSLKGTVSFFLGLSPYILQWAWHLDTVPLQMEILRFKFGDVLFPSWDMVGYRLLSSYLVPLMLACAGWLLVQSREEREKAWWIVRFAAVACIGAAIGPLQCLIIPRLFAIYLLRMSGFLFLFSLILSGFLLRKLLRHRSIWPIFAGFGLFVFLILSAGGGRVREIVRLVKDVRAPQERAVLWADVHSHRHGVRDKKAFLDLCLWARSATSTDDLFLSPPDTFASFRVYAKRPLFVTLKEGAVVMFSGALAEQWYDRYLMTKRLYQTFRLSEIISCAKRYGISYLIQESAKLKINLPIVYENSAYRVYKLIPT